MRGKGGRYRSRRLTRRDSDADRTLSYAQLPRAANRGRAGARGWPRSSSPRPRSLRTGPWSSARPSWLMPSPSTCFQEIRDAPGSHEEVATRRPIVGGPSITTQGIGQGGFDAENGDLIAGG